MKNSILKQLLTTLLLLCSITTWGKQHLQDSLPKGSYMLTSIINDNTKLEYSLKKSKIENYKVFGKNSHADVIVRKYIVMEVLPQITFNDTIGEEQFSPKYFDFKDNKLTRRTYNYYSKILPKIFPQDTWASEIYENNVSTRLFYNALKCIKTEEDTNNPLLGVYKYIENNQEIFIAYSEDCYFTFLKEEKEKELWMGVVNNIKADKNGYIVEDVKIVHTEFIGDSILELKEKDTNNKKILQRSELPDVLKEVFEYVNLENFSWHRIDNFPKSDPQPSQVNQRNDVPLFTLVEQQPEFPGGMKALMKYLRDNIQYPRISRENNSQGKPFVNFVVNTDGSIQDVKVIKSSGDVHLDAEAVRVVKAMPKWNPGKQAGKAVRVQYTMPVTFKLQ